MNTDAIKLKPSPFAAETKRPRVFVTQGEDPYRTARAALSCIDLACVSGKRVLLKPNAGRVAAPGSGIITDARVVAAAIDAFREAGAIVAVGESPITGVKVGEAFEASGIAQAARERRCPLIDMDAGRPIEVPLPDGKAIDSIKVCREALEYDVVVSMPVMKIHMHTGVTLAVKNMKGCLWRRCKVDLHMLPILRGEDGRSLDIAIADMAGVLRPHLSIVDGTVGMEGLGPSAGKSKALGVVVAGTDPFAVDGVACGLMGRNAGEIPHLRIGAERGYGTIDLEKISVSPETWRDLGADFEPAPENLSIEFPNVNILDEQSCSACQSTLLLFLQRHGDELREYFPAGERINIAIGKGHTELPAGTLCIGNCTSCHKDRGPFVAGCPPVGSAILKIVQTEGHPPGRQVFKGGTD